MKMYKRLLALALAFSMMLVLPVFAETETTEAVENTYYTELADKLTAIGIWSLEKGADDTVNRGEFAQLMADLVNADGALTADVSFIDVDSSSDYYGAIAYMKNNNIMNGIDSQRFAPLRTITYNEALKTIVTLLGYGDRAEIKGGYPNGYISIGLDLGFNIGSGELTAFEAAKLIDQAAFDVRLMTVVGYTTNEAMSILGTSGDTTVLNQYHDIYLEEGKVTDNGITELFSETSINSADAMVKIDGELYNYDDTDIRRALGSTIDYYYKEESGIKTLLWWEYTYANRQELVVYAEDLLKDNADFTKTQLVYRENNKTYRAQINPRAAFIHNEIAYPIFTVADLKAEEGWFTLVDEDGDNVYDIIFAEVYENYFVTSESNDGTIFSDRFYRSVDTSKFEVVEVFNSIGEDIFNDPSNKIDPQKLIYLTDRSAGAPAKAVAANTVISVFKSKTDNNGEGRYLRIILSDATVTETLNAITTDDEKSVYTVGTRDYELNDFLSTKIGVDHSLSEIKIGEKYRFYLDYRGQITYFDAISAINQYAYLLSAGKESDGLNPGTLMKMVLESGELAVLPCADEVLLNGAKTDEALVLSNTDIKTAEQLIRIKMNGKGEIKEVNTAPELCESTIYSNVGYDPTQFSMVLDSNSAYYYTNNRNMIDKYAVDTTTKLFYIPQNGREEDIRVYNGSEAASKMEGNYKVKAYDADNVHTAKVFVYTDIPDTDAVDNGRYYNFCYIVTDVKGAVNHNGEDVKQIRAWCYDYEYNLIENEAGILPADVKAGDILRLKTNDDERIVKASKILSTKGDTRPEPFAYTKTDKTRKAFNKSEAVIYGYPVGRNNLGITVASGADGTQVNFYPFYTPGIVYFDVENMDCSTANRASIPVFATLDEATGKFNINNKDVAVLVTTSSSGMYDCIIIHY